MKKLLIVIMALAIGFAFYEQSKPDKNVYLLVIAIVVFMFGLMRLSAKTPSKNNENNDQDVE